MVYWFVEWCGYVIDVCDDVVGLVICYMWCVVSIGKCYKGVVYGECY